MNNGLPLPVSEALFLWGNMKVYRGLLAALALAGCEKIDQGEQSSPEVMQESTQPAQSALVYLRCDGKMNGEEITDFYVYDEQQNYLSTWDAFKHDYFNPCLMMVDNDHCKSSVKQWEIRAEGRQITESGGFKFLHESSLVIDRATKIYTTRMSISSADPVARVPPNVTEATGTCEKVDNLPKLKPSI